jgi:hypothetical protein
MTGQEAAGLDKASNKSTMRAVSCFWRGLHAGRAVESVFLWHVECSALFISCLVPFACGCSGDQTSFGALLHDEGHICLCYVRLSMSRPMPLPSDSALRVLSGIQSFLEVAASATTCAGPQLSIKNAGYGT